MRRSAPPLNKTKSRLKGAFPGGVSLKPLRQLEGNEPRAATPFAALEAQVTLPES
jgi:hypothetical protein